MKLVLLLFVLHSLIQLLTQSLRSVTFFFAQTVYLKKQRSIFLVFGIYFYMYSRLPKYAILQTMCLYFVCICFWLFYYKCWLYICLFSVCLSVSFLICQFLYSYRQIVLVYTTVSVLLSIILMLLTIEFDPVPESVSVEGYGVGQIEGEEVHQDFTYKTRFLEVKYLSSHFFSWKYVNGIAYNWIFDIFLSLPISASSLFLYVCFSARLSLGLQPLTY